MLGHLFQASQIGCSGIEQDVNTVPVNVWGTHQTPAPLQYSHSEDTSGIHLPCKLHEHGIDGYYKNVFTLLKPESNADKTVPHHKKEGVPKDSTQ